MTIEFVWQLPVAGDGRFGNATQQRRGERANTARPAFSTGVTDPRGDAFNYFDYLHQVARAADLAGFDGLVIPDDPSGDESWIVAGYVARGTRHLRLIAEFQASRGSAVYAAKNTVSFQRFVQNRFAWQLVAGAGAQQRRWYGDNVPDADLLPRIEEFVTVSRGVISGHPFTHKGKFFEVADGGFQGPLAAHPVPPVYLTGNSDEALRLSARSADVHVFDALPLAELRPLIERLSTYAREAGRTVTAGLRIDVLARESEREALFDARRFLEQSGRRGNGGDPVIAPNYWEGYATERTGAAAALFGDYAAVSARLVEYAEAGIGSFSLAAIPHFEEAYRVGEYILPAVRAALGVSRRLAA